METLSNLGNSNMSNMISMGVGNVSEGDAHFFEDTTTPAKVRQFLDSMKVAQGVILILHVHINSRNFFVIRKQIN
jgi:hypothetical protein